MRLIQNQKLLAGLLAQYRMPDPERLPYLLLSYEAGELLAGPTQDTAYLQLIVSGRVAVYSILDDGSQQSIGGNEAGAMLLGDVEFVDGKRPPFFSEARTWVLTVALPMEICRLYLSADTEFLQFLLRSLAGKISVYSQHEATFPNLEAKVLHYCESSQDKTIRHIERAAFHLHCSRRQLQRILKKLTDEGKLKKTAKGVYCLAKTAGQNTKTLV